MKKVRVQRLIALVLATVLTSTTLVACGTNSAETTSTSTSTELAASQEPSPESSAKAETSADASVQVTATTRTVTDQDGTEVEIPENVEKIADLWHANNQIVLLLGGADKLVATTQNIKDKPWFKKVYPRISEVTAPFSGDDLQVEELVKLAPDVVLSSNDEQIQAARTAGIPAVKVMFQNFEDMRKTILLTAEVIGPDATTIANNYLEYLDGNIDYVAERVKDVPEEERPTVLHIVNGSNLLKVDGTNCIIDEWIKLGGGQNALTTEGNMMEVTMEEIVKADPDVIIVGSTTTEDALASMKADPAWASLRAVTDGNVYGNPQGTFPWDRYSAEEALQVLWVAKLLHPTKFEDLDMVAKTQEFYSEFLNYNLTEDEANQILKSEDPS